MPETCREFEINVLRISVHVVASFETDYTGLLQGQQNMHIGCWSARCTGALIVIRNWR